MKSILIYLGLAAGLTSANIIFNHVPISCNPASEKSGNCLRGQFCSESGSCVSSKDGVYVPAPFRIDTRKARKSKRAERQSAFEKRDTAPRGDGRCGKDFDDATCDPNGEYGGCCSEYGYCGKTTAHCLKSQGCQSGCTITTTSTKAGTSKSTSKKSSSSKTTSTKWTVFPTPSSTTTPRSDGRCGKAFGGALCDKKGPFGGCCSSYGYCGTTDQHCFVADGCQSGCDTDTPTTTSASGNDGSAATSSSQEPVLGSPTATAISNGGGDTTDGTCGAANGNTVCGNWPQGSCCSMYGFCGDTDAHCGTGCQSGPCVGAPASPAPGPSPAPANPVPGTLAIVGQAGVPAMHAGLMPNGRVIFLDKVENYTQIQLSDGQYAYSAEYDPETNQVVGLQYETNAFCSGGAFLPDGRWLSLGGNAPLDFIDPTVGDGFTAIRYLSRSSSDASLDGQAWSEPGNKLSSARWYASAQTMPDGTIFVASGSLNGLDPTVPANNNPTWELLNSEGVSNGNSVPMDILAVNQPYYMYPFIHLMRDGNLFFFTSKSSESFNVGSNTTVTKYPDLAGDYRTYPNTGGSVLLPLTSGSNWDPDIIICGGGAYQDITSPTEPSCGRIQPLSADPTWEMDSMPQGRGMVEGTLLPDGSVIWLNGCNSGAQGFGLAKDPTEQVLIYQPGDALGQRWSTGPTSTIARLYHSVALLLLDGTLMVAGSNPVEMPMLKPVANQVPSEDYVTEFRVEIYTPAYLQGDSANRRPTNINISNKSPAVGSTFTIEFTAPSGNGAKGVKVALYHGGFVTHSLHMNHRLAFLDYTGYDAGATSQTLTVTMPPNSKVAPPGPYVIYVVLDGVPGYGQFVSVH